ncbi:MAG: right-handed parallel beta-helix repeat-containing protein, partial [Candidatus Bathyarchaeota archaeon]|nr:right-handed parallel beta-helix repeat-containing protein [Candidatus Bathyarchaeota archaeon]
MKSFSTSKKTVFAIVVMLFLLSTLTSRVKNQSVKAEPGTLTVPFDYEKIQWAIGNATSGDTILILNGTYYEHLSVDKSLTLIGESKENTIIDGNGENRTVIEIIANNVVISGFTVQNTSQAAGTSYAGIRVSGSGCNVTNNIVSGTKVGIFVTSQKNQIRENVARNNGHGIALHSASEVTMEGNNASANTVGISLALSSNNMIVENSAVNSSIGGHGIILSTGSFNNTIFSNYLAGNYHGMWLSDSYENLIMNNTITKNELLGIELASSANNTFYHNNFIDNPKHIVIDNKSISIWDDGYPSGGNYWHGYVDVDEKSGPN